MIAYDAPELKDCSKNDGLVPKFDPNKRRGDAIEPKVNTAQLSVVIRL